MAKTLQEQRTGKEKIQKEGGRALSKPERHLAKKWTPEEVRKVVIEFSTMVRYRPEEILKDFGENVMPKFFHSNKKEKKETREAFYKALETAKMVCALDSHYALGHTIEETLRPLVLEFCNQLVKEYDCKTYSEKALAEIAAGAYVKHLRYSMRMESFIGETYLSHEKNGYMAILGKQLDRSIRTYIGTIQTLRQLKNPPADFSVIAKTAFIAQNQQVNAIHSKKE